jgi:hypothetical protein
MVKRNRHADKDVFVEPYASSYILRNITGYDINLGDLRYKIPAGRIRDLLSPTANLPIGALNKSIVSGSIKVRLGKSLIRVHAPINKPVLSNVKVITPSVVDFPQRRKSFITMNVGDITEEIKDLSLNEDEEYLKQLELEEKSVSDIKVPILATSDE